MFRTIQTCLDSSLDWTPSVMHLPQAATEGDFLFFPTLHPGTLSLQVLTLFSGTAIVIMQALQRAAGTAHEKNQAFWSGSKL